jgi:hypothetical protein
MKRLVVPKFETEGEEAKWWDDHMDVVEEKLTEAIENGTAHQGGPVALLRETRVLQVRIPNTEIERLERLAEEKGLSTQACINMLLRDSLDRHDAGKRKTA